MYGYTVTILRPEPEDDTFGFHFRRYWDMRHESATARRFCRILIFYRRIERERLMGSSNTSSGTTPRCEP